MTVMKVRDNTMTQGNSQDPKSHRGGEAIDGQVAAIDCPV